MISALYTSKSSSELELYLSSVNRGADICDKFELESCDLGRGMQGVNGLCDAVGTAGNWSFLHLDCQSKVVWIGI